MEERWEDDFLPYETAEWAEEEALPQSLEVNQLLDAEDIFQDPEHINLEDIFQQGVTGDSPILVS